MRNNTISRLLMMDLATNSAIGGGAMHWAGRKKPYVVPMQTQNDIKEKAQVRRERKAKAGYYAYIFSKKHNPCLVNTGKNWMTRNDQ